MQNAIRFLRRGKIVEVADFRPRTTLLDWLRLTERACGTKEACAEGDCGACTVVLRRAHGAEIVMEPVNACILLLGQVHAAEVITVEDLADADHRLHPVQAAMVEHHGSQCGFCTPGIVMSLFALHQTAGRPVSRQTVVDALAGNLCRCTGYRPIVDAGMAACAERSVDRFADDTERAIVRTRLHELDKPIGRADIFVGDETSFFAAPGVVESLADLYARHPDATLVAGCTDVGLWINKDLADLPKLIWLGRVEDFDEILDIDEWLILGAGATLSAITPHLNAVDPDLGELMRRFGSSQVRAAGTVGGNIANGSPIGDLAPAFIALDASLLLQRARRDGDETTRRSRLEDFFLGYGKQDRLPGEFVSSLWIPKLAPGQHFRCFKVTKRFDEDISSVMGAFRLDVEGGRIAAPRIAYGGMAGIPKRAPLAEAALAGACLADETTWDAALVALDGDFAPLSDHRASADYRRHTAKSILRKALIEIATGSTALTRIVGHREGRDAAA